MPTRARDVMQRSVLTVSPESRLPDVQRLFVEEGIGGAPVVDERGRVVGVITASDVLRAAEEEREAPRGEPRYYRDDLDFSDAEDLENLQEQLGALRAEDAMTPGTLSVTPDTTVANVARTLVQHRVHRVLVVDGDQLAGIVSTFDLVELVAKADL